MTVTLRRDKGVALTYTEMDDNFADYVSHRDKFDFSNVEVGKALAWDGEKFIPYHIEEAVEASGIVTNNLDSVTDRGATTTNVLTVGGLLPSADVNGNTPDLGSPSQPFGSLYLNGRTLYLGPNVQLGEGATDNTRLEVTATGIDINGNSFVSQVGNFFQLPSNVVIGTSAIITQQDLDDAIASLIDSAPGTLDTLNELAAALGDDANFATNITTAVNRRFNLDTHDTDDVPEGSTNLYYTDERVADHIGLILQSGSNIDITYADEAGTITVDSIAGTTGYDLSVNDTDDLDEGPTNLYYTDERVDDRVAQLIVGAGDISAVYDDTNGTLTISTVAGTQGYDLSSNTTDNLGEGGTNLYFTDERVDDRVNNLLIAGTNIDLTYDDVNDTLTVGVDNTGGLNLGNNTTSDLAEGTNLYYTDNRWQAAMANASTTDLTEGTNLYYTDARVDANIAGKTTDNLTEGTNLYYTDARVDANIATKTTTDLAEGTNLYYTDERVDDRVSNLLVAGDNISLTYDDTANTLTIAAVEDYFANNTTPDLAEGTNLYYTDARVDANIAAKSTDNLTEGSNLYFTTARARNSISVTDVSGDGSLSYNNTTGVITYTGPSASDVRAHFSVAGDLTYDDTTGEFSVTTYKSADFDTDFGNKTTDNLTEGSVRLYYTDARVQSYLTTNNYATTTNVSTAEGNANTYTDNAIAALIDSSPTTLDTLNELAAAIGDDANFATTITNLVGTKVSLADFNTLWEGRWSLKSTDDITESANTLYFTDARARGAISVSGDLSYDAATGVISYTMTDHYDSADFDTDFGGKDTGDLTEGTNLYFTNARAVAAARTAFQTNGDIAYDAATGTFAVNTYKTTNFNNDFGLKTTDQLTEGSNNLYFTRARVYGSLAAGDNISLSQDGNGIIHISATEDNLSNNTTTDLAEGTNLYYTDARAQAAISVSGDLSYANGVVSFTERTDQEVRNLVSASGDLSYNNATGVFSLSSYSGFDSDFAAKTTTDLTEGTNLYYTDARVGNYLTTNSYATETYVDNAVANLIDTAPEALDTLNELAAALGDDPDFATTVSTQLGTKFNTADFNTTFDNYLATKSADDLAEGSTTVYYTDDRVANYISTISSDSIAEGSNLYYTDNRVATYISTIDTDAIAEGTNQYFTRQRVQDMLVAGDNVTITSDVNGVLTISAVEDYLSNNTTSDLAEGTNLYFTNARARSAITVTGSDLTYNNQTGQIGINAVPRDVSDLTDTQNLLDHFSGSYDDLSDKPSIPSDIAHLSDISNLLFSRDYDDLTNRPANLSEFNDDVGYALTTDIPTNNSELGNGAGYITSAAIPTHLSAFINDLGYARIYSGAIPPPSPESGMLWFDEASIKLYVYFIDDGVGLWVQVSA